MFTHKTWTPPLSICNTLTIIENRLKMRKLERPKVKGVKNSKKNHRTLLIFEQPTF
jgi:hypothetical protein